MATGTTPPAPVPVARVIVTPASTWLTAGAQQAFVATPVDASGHAISGKTIAWASLTPEVAMVSSTGVVTGIATNGTTFAPSEGISYITATVDGKAGSGIATVSSTDAPVVKSLSISPRFISNENPSPTTARAELVSSGPPIQAASIVLSPPVGYDVSYSTGCTLRLSSGTANDGTWSCTIPSTGAIGWYQFGYVRAANASGGERVYLTAPALMHGFSDGLSVLSNTQDTIPPVLTEFTLAQDTIHRSGSSFVSIPSTVRASDAESGISTILIVLSDRLGSSAGYGNTLCSVSLATADRRDVTWGCTTSATFGTPGVYSFAYVTLTDRAGNARTYTNPQLRDAGYRSSLTIVP